MKLMNKIEYLRNVSGTPPADNQHMVYDASMDLWIPTDYLVDRLSGITPIVSGWDTSPTNLANSTDGDFTTSTGIGQEDNISAWTYGSAYFEFDMGAIYLVVILGYFTVGNTYSSGQNAGVMLWGSTDGNTWTTSKSNADYLVASWCNDSDIHVFAPAAFSYCRYIRLRCTNPGSNTTDCRLAVRVIKALQIA